MNTCVLVNSTAGPSTENRPILEAVRAEPEAELLELPDGEWERFLANAVETYPRIIAAGGDGTVHAIINAILRSKKRPVLGIVPLGTGNDLCRTLAVPLDPLEALAATRTGEVRELDAVRIEGDCDGYFANAITGGFSGLVAAEVTSETKAWWGPFAYVRGAVGVLQNLPRYRLTIRFDDGPAEQIDVLNLVIANARTAAGGLPVAPTADPEDGLFDVVLVKSDPPPDLTLLASRLMHGNYLDDPSVVHRRARRISLESDVPIPLSVDGERREGRCFNFEVLPGALRVVVGPEYTRTGVRPPRVEDEAEQSPVAEPRTPRERFFGLATGLLLVLKSLRSGSGLFALGSAITLLLTVWLARGVVADEWREWNELVHQRSRAAATESLDQFALAITWLGGTWGTVLAVAAGLMLFVRTNQYLAAGTLVLATVGVLLIEAVLKPLFGLTRPEISGSVLSVSGYSFPSGHALRGVGIYGLFAVLAATNAGSQAIRWLLAVIFAGIAVGICWSRVHLGVHWLTDVLMGGLLAGGWVSICLFARFRVERHWKLRRQKANKPDSMTPGLMC